MISCRVCGRGSVPGEGKVFTYHDGNYHSGCRKTGKPKNRVLYPFPAVYVACPCCLGDGSIDFTASDAMIGELYGDDELQLLKAHGLCYPLGVVVCDECDGTGIVSEERAADLAASAVALLDQALAKLRDRGVAPYEGGNDGK